MKIKKFIAAENRKYVKIICNKVDVIPNKTRIRL